MSESILPISADLWLDIDTTELANDGLFRLCSSSSSCDILIDKEEVPALIDALHKFLDEYGPKEQLNG